MTDRIGIQYSAAPTALYGRPTPHLEVNLIRGARMRYDTPAGEIWIEPNTITCSGPIRASIYSGRWQG